MVNKRLILAIDRNTRNLELLSQFLAKAGYSVLCVSTDEEIQKVFTDLSQIQLALVDLTGFDKGIWDVCEQLRTHAIPLLVISPKQSVAIQQESIVHGAIGMLIKPLVVKDLLRLIQRLLKDE